MLISHYNALCGQTKTVTGMVGTVEQECDISRVASQAYSDAAQLCDSEYLAHPNIRITAVDTTNNKICFTDVELRILFFSHTHIS